MRTAVLGVLLVVLAGCVSPQPGLGLAGTAPAREPDLPFPVDHDHRDPALHAHGMGLVPVAYHSLAKDGGARGDWLNSEVIVRGDHAYVGYLGGPWRFAIVDVADASQPRLVSQYPMSNAWTMDLAVSDEGDFVFVSLTTGLIEVIFDARHAVSAIAPPDGPAGPGVLVVDARDRAAPKFSSFFPIHGLGPHTATYHKRADGSEYLYAQKAELGVPGNTILILRIEATPTGGRHLVPVSTYSFAPTNPSDVTHDVDVQVHPITSQVLLYAAQYATGLVIVDVTDPARPAHVATFDDYPANEEVAVHDVHPAPALVDGRHYTLSGAELDAGPHTGHLRVYDTTDPTAPALVRSWRLPDEYVIDEPFLFSMHNLVFLQDLRVALAHGHAGVWILDWTAEEIHADGYHLPHPEGAVSPAWAPVVGAPWVWGTAVDDRGVVWASDVASGLHGYRVPPAGGQP